MVRTLAVTSSPSAVAAGGALDEPAALVAQRQRQAVDLGLGGEDRISCSAAAGTGAPARRIRRRPHRRRRCRARASARRGGPGKCSGRGRADPAGRGILAHQDRKARLDFLVAPAQCVVGRVRDRRRVLLVIALVVRGDLVGESVSSASACASVSRSITVLLKSGIIFVIPGPATHLGDRSPEMHNPGQLCCVLRLHPGEPEAWDALY